MWDHEKQFNTLTNIESRIGTNILMIDGETIFDLNINATLFPNNSTGILTMTEITGIQD